MQDFKLEYTEPDKVYDTVDSIKDETPQYRYYEIEVSRKQIAYVTVRVPFEEPLDMRNSYNIATRAARQLVKNYEWEDDTFGEIEVESINEQTEDEATAYDIYEAG